MVSTVMHYHQLNVSCSLDMFKFDMIVDDSFCCLNEWVIVKDSSSVSSFAKKQVQTGIANYNMTYLVANKILQNVS